MRDFRFKVMSDNPPQISGDCGCGHKGFGDYGSYDSGFSIGDIPSGSYSSVISSPISSGLYSPAEIQQITDQGLFSIGPSQQISQTGSGFPNVTSVLPPLASIIGTAQQLQRGQQQTPYPITAPVTNRAPFTLTTPMILLGVGLIAVLALSGGKRR